MSRPVRGADVKAERRLGIGVGGHHAGAAAGREEPPAELADQRSALVLERHRRHRHEDVVGEEVHQRLDISRLVGLHEPRYERPFRARPMRRRCFAISRRQPLLQDWRGRV